ncbi:MAG: M67 family metallopeptidase [Acidobacteriota bacterium]
MIKIDKPAWETMLDHARRTYPSECCGAMLGRVEATGKAVSLAIPLENAYQGCQRERYELRPEDLLWADRQARERQLDLVGIYHSHPDCAAYFSETDLKNSCPWYSFIVLSIRRGEFDHATSWLPNVEQTQADPEELIHPAQEQQCQKS